jgi:hypothetical protein
MAENVAVPLRDQDAGEVLEDLGQHDDRLAVGPQLQDPGIPHAVLGQPLQCGRDPILPGNRLPEGDVEAFSGVKPLFEGCVVAGELELVGPAQLNGDGLEGGSCGHRGNKSQ